MDLRHTEYRSLPLDNVNSQEYTEGMINNTLAKAGNKWKVGNEVKVGFMKLRILGSRAVKDWMPDIYDLESLDGAKKYEFIPHNGLHRVN